MAMMKNEMEILWAASTRLDDDTLFILTYQYHTEKDPADPKGRRTLREKSRYRMLGRIEKIADLEERMASLRRDENRLSPWKWPGDPSWDGRILYSNDSTNSGRSNWIRLKINKALPWEDFLRLCAGFKKDTDKTSPTFRQFVVPNAATARDMKGYSATDGRTVDADDREALLGLVGQNVVKDIEMKLAGTKTGR
jgi:hypothetical protein